MLLHPPSSSLPPLSELGSSLLAAFASPFTQNNRLFTMAFAEDSGISGDLLLPWQEGESWFWDTLVDADAANNSANWQWIAGCGADPSPFFRVFNPVLQGEKFDPEGGYVRRFVPELDRLPAKFIHHPWDAPIDVLAKAGIRLGETYPHPIVDHGTARDRALAAFRSIRQAALA